MISITLPQEIVKTLNATDLHILNLIADMCLNTSKHSPTGAAYAFPGEKWMAKRLFRCRTWISESVVKLEKLGLIQVIHRRKAHGYWQTNLYKVGCQILYYHRRAKEALQALLHRVGFSRHIVKELVLVKPKDIGKQDSPVNNKAPGLEDIILRMEKDHPELC